MYNICPKCRYERRQDDTTPTTQCPSCGILYEKWLRQHLREAAPVLGDDSEAQQRGESLLARVYAIPFEVPDKTEALAFYCRVAAFLGLLIWGWQFIHMDYYRVIGGARIDLPVPEIGESFMHLINTPFHEFGHIMFRPFGRTMMYLGGTLGQLLMPLTLLAVFLLKYRNAFAASVMLWWLGQSFMDCAPYINDADVMQLQLIGGGSGSDGRMGLHDWNNILLATDSLHRDDQLAALADNTGAAVMILAFLWGAVVLHRQYRNLD
jgi:hypothetical protein